MSSEKFYVYVYRCPITKIPFYVGKGCGSRIFKHLYETYKTTENKKKYAIIKNLSNLKLKPIIGRYAKNLTEERAYDIEEFLIQKWGRRDLDENGILTNVCQNNRPPNNIGRTHSIETIKKQSESKLGDKNPMYGKIGENHHNYGKPGLSGSKNGFYGKTHTIEVRQKVTESNRRRKGTIKMSDAQRKFLSKINCKTWVVTSPDNTEYIVENLKLFCRENNLCKYSHLMLQRLHLNYTKTGNKSDWHGWKCDLKSN
jgi:hypothetical protein